MTLYSTLFSLGPHNISQSPNIFVSFGALKSHSLKEFCEAVWGSTHLSYPGS